jgi:hypothetical protein
MEKTAKHSIIRLHGLNALFRGFSGNASFFYMNTVFVVRVGAKEFSNLFLYSTMVSVAFYVLFLYLNEKRVNRSYLRLLSANILVALVFPWLPENVPFIFGFTLMCVATDLVATNVAITAVQSSINPALFNEVYLKVTNRELLARILATGVVALSTHFEMPWIFFLCYYAASIGHFVCFRAITRSMTLKEKPIDPRTVIGATQEAFRYMFTNPFLRTTTILVVWAYSAKFLIEYLLYQKTVMHLDGMAEVGPFLSTINFLSTVLAFGMGRLFARKMTAKLPLSTLLSILPILCLVGGAFNLIDHALWPIVGLSLGYYMVNRALFLPSSRHCYVIVPTALRKNLSLTLPIFIAVVSLSIGAGVSFLKHIWGPEQINVLFMALTVPILFLLNQFDSRYIRNLWEKFREVDIPENSGVISGLNLEQMPEPPRLAVQAESLASPPTPPARSPDVKGYIQKILAVSEDSEALDRDQEHRMIGHCLRVYRTESDRDLIKQVVEWHKNCLESDQDRDRVLALTLIEALGFRAFDAPLRRFIDNPASGDLASVARLVLEANRELRTLSRTDFSFSTEVRFRFLFGKYMRSESPRGIEGLRRLVRQRDGELVKTFIEGLFSTDYKPLRSTLRACLVKGEGQRLDIEPLITRILEANYEEGECGRRFLQELRFNAAHFRSIDRVLAPYLVRLASEGFHIWDRQADQDQRDLFRNLLFVREWSLPKPGERREILSSIPALLTLEEDQRLMLAQVHLEQIKGVPSRTIWASYFAAPREA